MVTKAASGGDEVVTEGEASVGMGPCNPKDLLWCLYNYQRHWIDWALKKEDELNGGILGDQDGLGKTFETIALVLAKREILNGCTLVICPGSVLPHWEAEIQRSTTKGSTRVVLYRGRNRDLSEQQLDGIDFVLTTYYAVISDYTSNQDSILFSRKWLRVVVDEAQEIKDKNSSLAKAILAMESSYRWALSGTLLQKSAGELYPLIHSLRIGSYTSYKCSDDECDCKLFSRSHGEKCTICFHANNKHFCWWDDNVANRKARRGGKKSELLKQTIFHQIMLRRTKEDIKVELPLRIVSLMEYTMDKEEEWYYSSLVKPIQGDINNYVQQGTEKNHFVQLLAQLTRLRQAVNHRYTESSVDQDYDFKTSTKVEALREQLSIMNERDGSAKGVVVSQFTPFLDFIAYSLEKSGIRCVQLVGNMSKEKRDAGVTEFNEDSDCQVLLMELKIVEGIALNLTVASHVFMMEPCWRVDVEHAAYDTVHRVGQQKTVRIIRFIMKKTIEEKIVELQKKKEKILELERKILELREEEKLSGKQEEAPESLTLEDFEMLLDKDGTFNGEALEGLTLNGLLFLFTTDGNG